MKVLDKIINENINKFLKENIENEYLDRQFGMPLKKYFHMSDEDKEEDRKYRYSYIAYNFAERECAGNPDLEEEFSNIDIDDVDGIYEFIERNFGKHGLDKLQQYIMYNGEDVTYDVMDYTKDIHNEWLIHFSNNAGLIADEGFRYATYDMDELGYSNAGETSNKDSEGWDFAYVADEVPFDGNKYGKEAVMFRASGIQASHYGDQEEQVMFWNKDAKDIVYIENGKDGYAQNSRGDYVGNWYVTSRITSDVLYDNDDIRKVIAWVENNFDQYRKHLIASDASKVRNNSLKNSELNYRYKIK